MSTLTISTATRSSSTRIGSTKAPARRRHRPARPEPGCGRRGRAADRSGEAAEPLRPDRCRRSQSSRPRGTLLEQAEKGLAKRKVFAPASGHGRGGLFPARRGGEGGPGGDRAAAASAISRCASSSPSRCARRCRSVRSSRSLATAVSTTSPPRSASSRARPNSRPR